MSNRIKKFDGGGEVGGSGFAWGLAQEMASPELGMISDAQYTDRIISMIEDGYYYGQTPEQLEAERLGLSVAQYNAKTEDMLDSIMGIQGATESGLAAAESILKGKIAQAGVTDPAAQEAALKSGMESIEKGGSGLDAVKAAAAGAQDFVEGLLKTAKDAVDAGYDKLADFLPEGAMPDTVGIDPTTGQTTAVYGKTSGTPVLGGTVGTQGGGTYAGITTTGSAIVDKLIKVIKEGGSASSVISASTGLPGDVVDAAVEAAQTVKAGIEANTLDTDDRTNVVLTPGAGGDDAVGKVLGDGVTTTTGDEIIDPNSTNQVLTVSDTTKKDDEILGGGAWQNDGAGSFEEVISKRVVGDVFDAGSGPDDEVLDEVISGRIIGDGLDAGTGPDDKVVDDKVVDEVISGRIIGDPFTFEPVADEEVPPILDEVPPEPPPEVPEVPEAAPSFFGIRTEPGEKVDIDYFFEAFGDTIFAPKVRENEEDPLAALYAGYAEGGIVQDYDIEELIRFLENQRG